MAEITLPDELLERVEVQRPKSMSAEQFVVEAVQQKLAWQQRKAEFYRLSDNTQGAMDAQGISEAEVLGDFENFRASMTGD